jgi:CheY-like chemotaxis protein
VNPVEALEQFQSKPDQLDLVITDMTMPQMIDAMLSGKIKGVRPDIPVIICTGYSSLIDEEKGNKLGIFAYVMKPIVKRDIAKAVREVLDNPESSAQYSHLNGNFGTSIQCIVTYCVGMNKRI